MPSPDAFDRVFAEVNPGAFSRAFGRWMAAARGPGRIRIGTDGTSARAAGRATENRLTSGRARVPDGSNEIAVIPELLRARASAGALPTGGAAGCPGENAALIRRRGGHHGPAVEGNRPTREAAIRGVFDRARGAAFVGVEYRCHASSDDAHGRAVVQVIRERTGGGVTTTTVHYDRSSCRGTAAPRGRRIRAHWGIEKGSHRILAVASREDDGRVRAGHAGANSATIRNVPVALRKRAPGKGSTVAKRPEAGWDERLYGNKSRCNPKNCSR